MAWYHLKINAMSQNLDLTSYKIWLLVLLIITTHLGFNEFASVQFITFLIIAIASYKVILSSFGVFLLLITLLITSVFISGLMGDHSNQLILKGIRSAVVLAVLCIWSNKSSSYALFSQSNIESAIGKVVVISLILGTLQLIDSLTINSGKFDIPSYLYSLEYGTLLDDTREKLSAINVFLRPTSFYSEPSAYAAIGLLGLATAQLKENLKLKVASLLLIISSGSLSGAIFSLLFLTNISKHINTKKILSFLLLILIALVVAFLFSERIDRSFSGEDLSTQIRIFEPMHIISKIMSEGLYFGSNTDYLLSLSPNQLSHVFDNWILNQVLYYGVLGALWIAIPFIWLRGPSLILFFALSILNGDSVYYDRFFIIFLLIQQQIQIKK